MASKLVSVVMPARNAAMTVVESVRSVLSQSEVYELILVDDGSIDGTAELAKVEGGGRVRVVQGPQRGVAEALNAGANAATGDFMARCDADDLYLPGRFSMQLEWLRSHPDFIAISGAFASMTPDGCHIADLAMNHQAHDATASLQDGLPITHLCTWLIRREAWLQTGGARSWFVTGSDLDLQCRLAFLGRVWFEPQVVYFYRLHGSSITHSRSKQELRFYDCWREEFARQRAERGTDDLEDGRPPEVPEFGVWLKRNSWRRQAIGHLMGRAWAAHGRGELSEAHKIVLQAICLDPCQVMPWKTLAMLSLKRCRKQ